MGGAFVAVGDDGVALGDVVFGVVGGDIGVVDIGRVGKVDNEGRDAGILGRGIGWIAAEEGWTSVQAKVLEGGDRGDAGESGVVLDGLEGAAVSGLQGGAVRPAGGGVFSGPGLVRVSRGVNSEDNVDMAFRLDQRVEGNVLVVLASINESELGRVMVGVGCVVPLVEWVWVVCNVVVVFADTLEHSCKNRLKGTLERAARLCAVQHKQAFVKERAAGAHDEATGIEASDTLVVVVGSTSREVGAEVLHGSKTVHSRIVRSHLPGVELVDSRVGGNQKLTRSSAIGDDERHRRLCILEPLLGGDARESIFRATIGGVDKLVGESTSPVVGERGVVASTVLILDRISNGNIVSYRVENLNRSCFGALENRVLELP